MNAQATLAAVAALSLASAASAQVIVNDTFSRTVTGSFGTTDNGVNYISNQTAQSVNGNAGVFGQSANTLQVDAIAAAPTALTVSYSGQRAAANGFISSFFGVSNGTTPALIFDVQNAGADFGVLVQQSQDTDPLTLSRIALFSGGVEQDVYEVAFNTATAPFALSYTVAAPSGFGAGNTGQLALTFNGLLLGSTSVTFDGTNTGYATVASNQGTASIDNLVISAVVPEPASLGMLGLGALSLVRRRRTA